MDDSHKDDANVYQGLLITTNNTALRMSEYIQVQLVADGGVIIDGVELSRKEVYAAMLFVKHTLNHDYQIQHHGDSDHPSIKSG